MVAEERDRKLRLVLVIEEERFHHPGFVQELIRVSPHPVVGAVRVVEAPPQSDVMSYLFHHVYRFRPMEIVQYGWRIFSWSIQRCFGRKSSVADVLKRNRIPYFDVRKNINRREIRQRLSAWTPDIIVSSNPLYFGAKILDIPRLGCINRHTALLPAYQGILPLFHALARNESIVGVTIHKMTADIDEGPILAQAELEVAADDTMETLFDKCFALTVPLVMEAVDRLASPVPTFLPPRTRPSRHSFPRGWEWKQFRKAGRRLI